MSSASMPAEFLNGRRSTINSFEIAKFYEKYKKWKGALVYYNEVTIQDPNSAYAAEAAQRISVLKARTEKPAR